MAHWRGISLDDDEFSLKVAKTHSIFSFITRRFFENVFDSVIKWFLSAFFIIETALNWLFLVHEHTFSWIFVDNFVQFKLFQKELCGLYLSLYGSYILLLTQSILDVTTFCLNEFYGIFNVLLQLISVFFRSKTFCEPIFYEWNAFLIISDRLCHCFGHSVFHNSVIRKR